MFLQFLLKRIFYLVPVLLGVSLIVFLFIHLTPGDPIEMMMGEAGGVTDEEIEALRHQFGLDRPLPIQYLRFVSNAAQGDLGQSITDQRPVVDVIRERIPATVELTLCALLFALVLAIPLGIISAWKQHSALDSGATVATLLGVSMPGFWLGIVLVLVFGMRLEWLPVTGRIDYGIPISSVTGFYLFDSLLTGTLATFFSAARHLILPSLALGAATAAISARMIRSSMLEVIRQDYILFARAKGLSEGAIALRHALKNALIPVVSVVGLQVGVLLGGNMIIETVFGWPGLGRLAVDAIYARNYPVVQGVVLLYAVTYVFINLLTDFLYALLNPKIEMV